MSDIRIQVRQIDANWDGKIDEGEWNKWTKDLAPSDRVQIVDKDGKVILDALKSAFSPDKGFMSESGAIVELFQHEADKLQGSMQELLAKIKDAKDKGVAEEHVEKLQQQLKGMVDRANTLFEKANKNYFKLTDYNKAAGMENGSRGGKAVSIGTNNGEGASPQAQGAKAQMGGGGGAPALFPPAGWAAQTIGGAAQTFNSSAYLQSMAVEDNVMNSWDAVTKNVNQGKQLAMLFAYFAKMAESGDMNSMYQFMKFITYIVSKDKAKQQIEMGKKLIQLQDLSRSWTNKLMGLSSNANDPNASNELMKTMTIVKSETDAIATSQKLISQMMEEFAQVVETLTNTTKAALQAAGNIARTVSTIR